MSGRFRAHCFEYLVLFVRRFCC